MVVCVCGRRKARYSVLRVSQVHETQWRVAGMLKLRRRSKKKTVVGSSKIVEAGTLARQHGGVCRQGGRSGNPGYGDVVVPPRWEFAQRSRDMRIQCGIRRTPDPAVQPSFPPSTVIGCGPGAQSVRA